MMRGSRLIPAALKRPNPTTCTKTSKTSDCCARCSMPRAKSRSRRANSARCENLNQNDEAHLKDTHHEFFLHDFFLSDANVVRTGSAARAPGALEQAWHEATARRDRSRSA